MVILFCTLKDLQQTQIQPTHIKLRVSGRCECLNALVAIYFGIIQRWDD